MKTARPILILALMFSAALLSCRSPEPGLPAAPPSPLATENVTETDLEIMTSVPVQPQIRMDLNCSQLNSVESAETELNQKWLCIVNGGASTEDLTGWTLHNHQALEYRFAKADLSPGGVLKIHSGSGADTSTDLFWGSQIQIWPNTRGAACLYDAQGRLSAEFQYAFDMLPTSEELPEAGPISLVRPVPGSVPNELGYGCQKKGAHFSGFHNGYDYSFNRCDPISEPVWAAGEGKVLSTWVDVPLPLQPGQLNGGLRIDHGVHAIADGRVVHLISEYDHVLPLVEPDAQVKSGDRVADFSTCERFGYSPKLHFQVIALDPRLTAELSSQDLHSYLVELIHAGEQLTIDPALAGLPPD